MLEADRHSSTQRRRASQTWADTRDEVALYKSILAYDGTAFHGFQRQASGVRTVQGVTEAALRRLGWQEQSLAAAGRTDAGVHARGQVVSFRLPDWTHGPEALTRALNDHLPGDVAIWHTSHAEPGFHPRYSARRRWYRYSLVIAPHRDPLRERYAWRRWPEPDLSSMSELAESLVGRRDFGAFGTAPRQGGNTVREVFRAEWRRHEDECCFDIEADAFLYRMVRRLAAACVMVGEGKRPVEAVLEHLQAPTRRWQAALAPPKGLCLQAVYYED